MDYEYANLDRVYIATSDSLSSTVTMEPGFSVCALGMPAAWTAASVSFLASVDGSTFDILHTVSSALASTEFSITSPAVSTVIALDPAIFATFKYIRVRSGTSASPVTQDAKRELRIFSRPV